MFLTSEYSFLWLVPVTFIAIALSYIIYRQDKYLKNANPFIKWGLFSLRLLTLLSIGFFLIKPLITNTKKDYFKAQLLILQDNTLSIKLNKDSLFYQNEFLFQVFRSAKHNFHKLITHLLIFFSPYHQFCSLMAQ